MIAVASHHTRTDVLGAMQRLICRHQPFALDEEDTAPTAHTARPRRGADPATFLAELLISHVWHTGDTLQMTVAAARVASATWTEKNTHTAGYGSAIVAAQSQTPLLLLLRWLQETYGYGQIRWQLDACGTLQPVELVVQAKMLDSETNQAFKARLRSDYVAPLTRAYGIPQRHGAYDPDGTLVISLTVPLR